MERSKIIVLCLTVSMIALTINLGMFDAVTPKESLAKTENDQDPPEMEWNQTFGGTEYDEASAMVQTTDGGFALAGETNSFGTGRADMWLVRTDANGVAQWNKTFGGTEWDSASALVQTTDGGFALAGETDSFGTGGYDMWLVKTDANGIAQWNQTYGGTGYDVAYSMILTTDGGFALAGGTSSFDTGKADMWLVKTDANGVTQWNQTYGGTGIDYASALVQTTDGGFALAGREWLVKTDANGVAQWNKTFGTGVDHASALVQTTDGGFALAGDRLDYGHSDMLLVKTDVNGVTQWNKTFGTNSDCAYALVQTTDGGFVLAGREWLVKTDANGVTQWNQTYGGTGIDYAYAMVQTMDGGFALAGGTSSFDTGKADMWLVKTKGTTTNSTTETTTGPGIPGFRTFPLLAAVIVLTTWHKRKK